MFSCALSASWVCSSPLPSSSFPWQLLPPAPSWAVSSSVPLVRCFPVNGFSLQSRGKISSKFHYHGTKVTSLLSNEPWRYTAEEAPHDQVDKLTHSVDISQSYPSHPSACSLGHKQGGHSGRDGGYAWAQKHGSPLPRLTEFLMDKLQLSDPLGVSSSWIICLLW